MISILEGSRRGDDREGICAWKFEKGQSGKRMSLSCSLSA